MTFHRLTLPSYFISGGGALPAGYDYLNDPTGGGSGTGIAAPADTGAKSGGDYDGTYFIAGREQAAAFNVNRGFRALGENCDALDDALHSDLVDVQRTNNIVSAGDTFATLDGSSQNVFVGNGSDVVGELFTVVDSNDKPIYDPATGVLIVVSSLTNATVGTGFSSVANIRTNFNVAIPASVTYRVIHGRRSSGLSQPNDIISAFLIPSTRDPALHIQDILRGGLDARYRNASTVAGGKLDTAGTGSTITRDGKALFVQVPDDSTADYATGYKDPYLACFRSGVRDGLGGTTSLIGDGGIGFVAVLQRKQANNANDLANDNQPLGGFLSVIERTLEVDTIGGVDVRTRVSNDSGGSLNPDAGSSDDDRRVIELPPADYFYNVATTPANQSEIIVGIDMIRVNYVGSLATRGSEVYVITALDGADPRRCSVRTLAGGRASFPSGVATTDVTFQLVKVNMFQSSGASYFNGSVGGSLDPVVHDGFMYFVPPQRIDSGGSQSGHLRPLAPVFVAAARTAAEYDGSRPKALQWGGFDSVGASLDVPSALLGDGSLDTHGRSFLGLGGKWSQLINFSATGSHQWDIDDYPRLALNCSTDAQTITLTLPAGYTPQDGDEIEVTATLGAAVVTQTIVWPSTIARFAFTSTGDKQPTPGNNSRTKWTGTYTTLGGTPAFLMTKTAYDAGGVL